MRQQPMINTQRGTHLYFPGRPWRLWLLQGMNQIYDEVTMLHSTWMSRVALACGSAHAATPSPLGECFPMVAWDPVAQGLSGNAHTWLPSIALVTSRSCRTCKLNAQVSAYP